MDPNVLHHCRAPVTIVKSLNHKYKAKYNKFIYCVSIIAPLCTATYASTFVLQPEEILQN
jgi:hypothetical protein